MNMKIPVLKDKDNVRQRLPVFFCNGNPDDICSALEKMIRPFLIEAYIGHCKKIVLTKRIDGSYNLISYDLGIDLGEIGDENPKWQKAFCKLTADWADEVGPFEYTEEARINSFMYGYKYLPIDVASPASNMFNLGVVQFVTAFMDVEVNRDGKIKRLRFEHGSNVADLTEEKSNDGKSYTSFSFAFDSELFKIVDVPDEFVKSLFARYSFLIGRIPFEYVNENTNEHFVFDFNNGEEYAIYLTGNENIRVFEHGKSATWQERYDAPAMSAEVRLMIGLNKDKGYISCLHNYTELRHQGTHYDVLKPKICEAINGAFREFLPELYAPDIPHITWEEIEPYLVLVLESYCPITMTKWLAWHLHGIKNRLITDLCEDLIHSWYAICHDGFGTYLERNSDALEAIIIEILENRKEQLC